MFCGWAEGSCAFGLGTATEPVHFMSFGGVGGGANKLFAGRLRWGQKPQQLPARGEFITIYIAECPDMPQSLKGQRVSTSGDGSKD